MITMILGMIDTNNIDEDKVYFTQTDIMAAFEEMGSKSKHKSHDDYSPMIKDDIKKQKQILM